MPKFSNVSYDIMPSENLALRRLVDKVAGGDATKFSISLGSSRDRIGRLLRPNQYTDKFQPLSRSTKRLITTTYNLPADWFETTAREIDKERGLPENGTDATNGTGDVYINKVSSPLSDQSSSDHNPLSLMKLMPPYDTIYTVRGDIMLPTYRSGDTLALRDITSTSYRQWGRVHLLVTTQGTFLARIFEDTSNSAYRCTRDNNSYPAFTIPVSDITHIYLVVASIRRE